MKVWLEDRKLVIQSVIGSELQITKSVVNNQKKEPEKINKSIPAKVKKN